MRALIDALGLAGTTRFLQAVGIGRGDYTAERHQWLDEASVEVIVAEARPRYGAHEE